jgi:SPP1 gp7 family putative phage head morphogenesis protein
VSRVTLPPVVHRELHTAYLERAILEYFKEVMFDPVRDMIHDAGVRVNEATEQDNRVLWDALMAGTIWYADGLFSGTFNAAISRSLRALGAQRRGLNFALAQEDVPIALRGAIAASMRHGQDLHEQIEKLLVEMESHLAEEPPTGIDYEKVVDVITEDAQEQFSESVASVEELPAPGPVPEDLKNELREELTQETELAIKNFTLETTKKLRAKVAENLSGGARPDRLAKVVETEFGVAQRKARTIADAETSIVVSRFRQRRFQDLGSKSYVWQTSGDEKVRPTHGESNNHRVLNGREFPWAEPPIVDTATGRRRHPGEDWGPCRCIARAVLVLK